MAKTRMDIQTVVVGGGPVASLVVLRPREDGDGKMRLPIRIGIFEAAAISAGVNSSGSSRPMTHDLLISMTQALGAEITAVCITDVVGSTFFARIELTTAAGEVISVDARPSDAIAIAVRQRTPIFAEESVLATAALPDFGGVEKDAEEESLALFHDFVEGLSPEDFSSDE